jgi:ferric hydroxamate transport system permease protein
VSGLDTDMVRAFDTALAPVALVIAVIVGAAHGLRPGHGKTMVAAYLIGEQGRRRHALVLAGVVAAMHTASVLVLGLVWWYTAGGSAVSIEAMTRWGQFLVAAVVAGLLLGDRIVLLGDVANWAQGVAGRQVGFVLDQRVPRVLAALLAGAALALAGTIVQAVCRNPLAEPSLLGVTSGAGLGAVLMILLVPGVGIWPMSAAAGAGAIVVFGLVYLLSARGGLGSERLVLVGIGAQAGTTALITLVVLVVAPWDVNLALTWLSGSTYGRSLAQLLPVALALLVMVPLAAAHRRELDVLALDDDTPRVLGLAVDRSRLVLLGAAALTTAAAVCAVGVIGFVGLVAPHAARALVGARHGRVLPVAVLLGAVLVSVADTLGRVVIAPAQIPAGLGTALLGAPYFVYLLWRSRGRGV